MDFVSEYNPDILCLQETKMQEGQEEINIPGYNQYWHSAKRKGYSGTLTLSKEKPLSSFTGIGLSWSDDEGRNTVCEYEDFYLINLYVPNSKEKLARLDERMEFEDHLRNYLSKLSEKKSLIVCGDLNVAHKEIDLKNPKTNRKNAGFSDEEREKFTNLLDSGFIDTFRYFNPELRKGDVVGDVSEDDMRRVQIRETILSHFEKERELFSMGIKILSLFFIDEVAKYRRYDEDGNELLGEYGKIFEQEYISVMNEYRTVLDPTYTAYLDSVDAHEVHKGYFSIDKKGRMANSSVKHGTDLPAGDRKSVV